MKIEKLLAPKQQTVVTESDAGTSTSASVAAVNQPLGRVKRRGQGSMLQGIKTSAKFPNSTQVKEGAYDDGVRDGIQGQANPRASSIYGPESGEYSRGYKDGLVKGKEQSQANVSAYQASLAPYKEIPTDKLKQMLRDIRKRSDEIQAIFNKYKGASLFGGDAPPNTEELRAEGKKNNEAWQAIHQELFQRGVPQDQRLEEADEWEEDTEKRERFLKYAKQKLLAAASQGGRTFTQMANALSQQDNKYFGSKYVNTTANLSGITVNMGEEYTQAIANIVSWIRSSQGQAEIEATKAALWLQPEGKEFINRVHDDLVGMKEHSREQREKHAIALSGYQIQHLGGKARGSFKGDSTSDPKDMMTPEVAAIYDMAELEIAKIKNIELDERQRAQDKAIWDALPYPMKVAMAAAAGTTPDGFEAAMFGETEADQIAGFFQGKQQFDNPNQQDDEEVKVAEAKKANTKTARKEFSKKPRTELSGKDKEAKQSESDRLWAMLQQHIADAEKNKEVKEAGQQWPDTSNSLAKRSAVATNLKGAPSKAGRGSGMTVATRVEPTITPTTVNRINSDRPIPSFLKPGPQTTGKFPEPRKPSFPGDRGSKSETMGKDGLIYHWQDPRAKQSMEETRVGNRMSDMQVGSPKVVHVGGRAVGEVGLDHDPSPGNGPYYMKHYTTNTWYSGYDSKKEALAELKEVCRQMGELSEGVAEGEIEQQHGDTKPWAYWGYPERVAKKLYQIYQGNPISKAEIVKLWKEDGPDRMTKFMLKPDVAAILSNYEQMSDQGPLFKEGVADTIKQFGKYMTEPQSPHNNLVRDRAKNIAKIRKQNEKKSVFEKDPEAMREFERSGGYKAGLDVMGWQVGWAAASHAKSTDTIKDAFQQLYYGGGSSFPFSEKAFKLGWVAYKKHYGPQAAIEEEGVAEGSKYKCTCHPGDADPDCPVHGLEPMEVGDALDVKLDEKSKSQAQFRTMAAVAHNPKFAKKVGISQSVGKEFHNADKKQNYKDLPKEVDEASFDYTMNDLGNDYAGFPSKHSLKHKFLAKIKPEKQQLYKDKMNNTHDWDSLFNLFKVAKERGDIIEQGVAEGSLNEFAPDDSGEDRTYEYEVYQCDPNDQFNWIGGPVYKTDDMAKAHSIAYRLHKKHPNKAFMIWQERSQGSRGGYGITDKQGVSEEKQRLDPKCWSGYKKQGTKMKGDTRVNNCVKVDEAEFTEDKLAQDLYKDLQIFKKGIDKDIGAKSKDKEISSKAKDKDIIAKEDWQKANKSDKTDGMSPKAVKAYRRENPGSKLQTAVTKKPSELKAGSKDAKRRKSFCARMSGNKGPMKDENGKPTPKAKALKRWNC